MKLKLFLASLALFAGTAQATNINTISTKVFIDEDNTVEYVDFHVTDAGKFFIGSTDGFVFDNSKLNPHALLFASPLNSLNFIAENDDILKIGKLVIVDDSLITKDLEIGSYVLALSNSYLSIKEAVAGYNSSVTEHVKGYIDVIIKSHDGKAELGHPSAVPVPAAAWLFGSALLGFAGFRRKSV
ncbi:MAG: hypothetical protein BVN34_05635 [Proteobacteria bacterium ST_bin12]|nr:MAG: hypothetical protein BVN34_05635 [Proteobacteria bacterium ST_bin12]